MTLRVLPSTDSDPTTLEAILQAILTEVVTSWPAGTTWIVELANGYLQGITYTPTCLLEFWPPPASADAWARAKQAGWLDPHTVPRNHSDYKSRAVWGDNPVQEVSFASTGIPGIVAILADAADSQLLAPRRNELTIEVFCNVPDADEDEAVSEHADLYSRPKKLSAR